MEEKEIGVDVVGGGHGRHYTENISVSFLSRAIPYMIKLGGNHTIAISRFLTTLCSNGSDFFSS